MLLANRLIAPAEYSAGGRYRWLFAGGVGRVGIPFLERPIGPGFAWVVTNVSGTSTRAAFLEARAILNIAGATASIENLVIYEQPSQEASQLLLIRVGLRALYRYFESEARHSLQYTARPAGGKPSPVHALVSEK